MSYRYVAGIFAAAFGLCTVVVASTAHANLLTNPSFEEPNVTPGGFDFFGTGQTVGAGWIVGEGGYIDVVTDGHTSSSASWPNPTDGDQFAYIGDSLQAASMFQDVSLGAGTAYDLSFDLATFLNSVGSGANLTVDILYSGNSIAGFPQVFTLPVPHDFQSQSLPFTTAAAGDYRILLGNSTGYGTIVDNFVLNAVVPEPCSASLAAMAVIGCAFLVRRGRASSVAC